MVTRSEKENRSYGEVRNNKTMLKILSLIRIIYLNPFMTEADII